MRRFHLAQVNIGRFRAPIDDPVMEGFRTQLNMSVWASLEDTQPDAS